jgi:hypothetical protein
VLRSALRSVKCVLPSVNYVHVRCSVYVRHTLCYRACADFRTACCTLFPAPVYSDFGPYDREEQSVLNEQFLGSSAAVTSSSSNGSPISFER